MGVRRLGLEAESGETISGYAKRCLNTAVASGCTVIAKFNDIVFYAHPTHFQQVLCAYDDAKEYSREPRT